METIKRKRITVKWKTPNPLFRKWLKEWYDEAKTNESKLVHCLNTALQSLEKYPLPLETGKDCKILHGFGDKLCRMLDEKLLEHQKQPEKKLQNTQKKLECDYTPQYRTGAYAIIIALYQHKNALDKNELIKMAQKYSNTSFTKAEMGTRYTAWSTMKGLISKKLVEKSGHPPKFALTEKGMLLGKKLFDIQKNDDAANVLPTQPSIEINQDIVGSDDNIYAPNSFDIILLVDKKETTGNKAKPETDLLLAELSNRDINYELKDLKVGDYTWICRHKHTKKELVIPYIIERKRIDDFAKSIKDGRYYEQKFRLKRTKFQQIIYLIEFYGNTDFSAGLPLTTLYQAATNTLIQDGFILKFVKNLRETSEYLATLTEILTRKYQDKTLLVLPKDTPTALPTSLNDDLVSLQTFQDFNRNANKTKAIKIKDMFIRMLLQIKGLSLEKALVIVDEYNTPKLLKQKFETCNKNEGELLLAPLKYGKLNRKIGPVLSKIVYQLFCNRTF